MAFGKELRNDSPKAEADRKDGISQCGDKVVCSLLCEAANALLTCSVQCCRAVEVGRPALEKFYQSLSDEQKERLNAFDQSKKTSGRQPSELASLCSRAAAKSAGLPINRIEGALRLSDDQEVAWKGLNEAAIRAADIMKAMKANCCTDQTLTPTGRLALMEESLGRGAVDADDIL